MKKNFLIITALLVSLSLFLIIGRHGSLISGSLIAFITTLFITPYIKRKFELIGLVGLDVQKKNRPMMATSGGMPVIIGFLIGIFVYVAYTTFISNAPINLSVIFAGIIMMLLITFLTGLLDDIIIQTERKTTKGERDIRIGLSQKDKLMLSIISIVPLMVVNAGNSVISIPLIGSIDLGLIYPLIIIPLIIIFCANATNMLAGMNGLETSLGIVLLLSTGVYALLYSNVEGALIALITVGALLGFLYYNKYPAKFLPGDTLTYLIGAGFAASIIIGNIEKFALIAFMPWFVEFLLKARLKFKASSLGVLQKDGTLKPKHEKIYSWTHIAMRVVKKEKLVTPFMVLIESLFCALAFMISRLAI